MVPQTHWYLTPNLICAALSVSLSPNTSMLWVHFIFTVTESWRFTYSCDFSAAWQAGWLVTWLNWWKLHVVLMRPTYRMLVLPLPVTVDVGTSTLMHVRPPVMSSLPTPPPTPPFVSTLFPSPPVFHWLKMSYMWQCRAAGTFLVTVDQGKEVLQSRGCLFIYFF